MKWISVAALLVFAVQVEAATDAGAKAAPKKKAAVTKPDAGAPAAKTDAGVAATKADAGVAPTKTDAGLAPMGDAGAKPAVDAGAAKEPAAAAPKSGAAYTLVAIPTPDKKVERMWKSKCGSCHGADGKAVTAKGKKMKMADISAAAWQTSHGNDELKKTILEGVKKTKEGVDQDMDAFGPDLTPEQVEELLHYVRWLGSPR